MRGELGLLGDQRCIDIDRPPAFFRQQRHCAAQQHAAVGALVARVGVGKVAANIAQRDGAEERIGNRVQQRVGVGMTEQPGCVRDFHAAEYQLAAFNQPMHVVTLPDSKTHFRPRKIIAAKARSAG